MTVHKHLKQLVRARMAKTGESYATARRQVIGAETPPAVNPATRAHFPGSVAATTALRVLLTHAGIGNPDTGRPYTEAMLFGLAGGIGMGVFSFRYEKEDFSSFFVAGRHKWADDLDYLRTALKLFGREPVVRESTSPGKAARELAETLAERGPCVVWVDRTLLPHGGFPGEQSGGGYHVITVYRICPEEGTALIGDLTDDPISIPLPALAEARARIKKQKNRLLSVPLSVPPGGDSPDLRDLIRQGLRNGVRELLEPSMKAARRNFQLEAVRTWAERMDGGPEADSWERNFRRGKHFWRGLTSVNAYVEHYGTGGGLCRPLFADFLTEASRYLPSLAVLEERYAELGRAWTDLAETALPDDVPLLRESKELLARKSELLSGGAEPDEIRSIWKRLAALETQADADFPLSESECRELRIALRQRLLSIYAAESVAFEELQKVARL